MYLPKTYDRRYNGTAHFLTDYYRFETIPQVRDELAVGRIQAAFLNAACMFLQISAKGA